MQPVLQNDQHGEFEEFRLILAVTTFEVLQQAQVFDQNHLDPGAQPQLNREEVHHPRAQIPAHVYRVLKREVCK